MDYLRGEPVILVFVVLVVLLVSAVLIETFRKPRVPPQPLQEQMPPSTRFTSTTDLAIILLALSIMLGMAAWVLN